MLAIWETYSEKALIATYTMEGEFISLIKEVIQEKAGGQWLLTYRNGGLITEEQVA